MLVGVRHEPQHFAAVEFTLGFLRHSNLRELVDTALLRGPRLLAGGGLQTQHFLARPGPERGIRIGFGQVGHALLFNEIALRICPRSSPSW